MRFPYKNGDLKASGAAGNTPHPHPRRRGTHHACARLLAGRQKALRHGRQRFQRWTNGNKPGRTRARAGLGDEPGRHRPEGFRLRHPQSGGHRHPSGHRGGVGQYERARRPGRRSRARLSSPASCPAVSTAGRGSTWATIEDPRKVGMHPELADKVLVPDVPVQSHSASLNLDVLYRQPVSGGVQRRCLRRVSRLVGTATSAPVTRSCACHRQGNRQGARRLRGFL